MNNPNVPVQSLKMLIISIISAIILAVIILITIVGPAEFGIDPTGLGKALGLTVLAKPQHHNAQAKLTCPPNESLEGWLDIVVITVPAASGLEYKFHLEKNAELKYSWSTNGSKLYFDFHGEPAGDTTGYFKSFKETTDNQSNGVLTAPFAGSHGWYWENKTQLPVQVTLKTKGQYTVKGLI
jgi:hypothetical protein